MKIETMAAFPNPIAYMSLGENSRDLNKQLVRDLLLCANVNKTQLRSGVGIDQTIADLQTRYDSFNSLKTIIDNIMVNVQSYFGIQGVPNSRTYWGNINNDGYAYHMPHSHNAKDILAGVYFPTSGIGSDDVDVPIDVEVEIRSSSRPDPGDLVFLDPIAFAKTPVIQKDNVQRYPFFGNPICVSPREGTLVLFPCWLPHMVTPTRKENFTRMSIAFGVDFTY
jgi:hypothetical protein